MPNRLKYKPEFCQMVVPHMQEGFSKSSLAGLFGVTRETLYQWIKTYPEFKDAVDLGEAKSRVVWEQMGVEGMRNPKEFNAAVWIFNMKNRFGWRDKQELTGADGGPIETKTKVLQVVGVPAGKTDDSR